MCDIVAASEQSLELQIWAIPAFIGMGGALAIIAKLFLLWLVTTHLSKTLEIGVSMAVVQRSGNVLIVQAKP